MSALVYDLLIILAAGLIAALVSRRLRISVLIGYLVVGAIIGEASLGWIRGDQHEVEYIAEAGVFLLLFSIGLEFSLDELARLGRNLIIGGGAQMGLVALPVAAILLAMGIDWQAAVLLAAAASFSSTVLVFKSLAEWGHSSLPHGRRAIGILLFQDAALIPLLLLEPLLTDAGTAVGPLQYVQLAATSIVFVVAVVLLRRLLVTWIVPGFASYRSPDLVILFAIVLLGAVTLAAYTVGLPPAIGAFAAGLALSGNRWTKQIDALVLPFRETFAAVFFVSLGLLFDVSSLLVAPGLMLGGFALLLAIKTVAGTIALRLTGLPWQSAAGMGIGLAHVGEFAFVLVLLGWEEGVIAASEYQKIVSFAIGSLILSPLLLKTGLRWTQVADEQSDLAADKQFSADGNEAIVIGAGPIGSKVAVWFETSGWDVCLVDLSPVNLHAFAQQGIRTVAGDATRREVLDRSGVESASIVVLCVPEDEVAVQIMRETRAANAAAFVLVRCRFRANLEKFAKLGANRIVSEEAEASNAIIHTLAELDTEGERGAE